MARLLHSCHSERSRGISNCFLTFELSRDVSTSLDMTSLIIRGPRLTQTIRLRQNRDAVLPPCRSAADYGGFFPHDVCFSSSPFGDAEDCLFLPPPTLPNLTSSN